MHRWVRSRSGQRTPTVFCGLPAAPARPCLRFTLKDEVMTLKLQCHDRYDLGNRRGLSKRMAVVDGEASSVVGYDLMCAVLDRVASSVDDCDSILVDIARIESGMSTSAGKGLDEYAVDFTKEGAEFWFEHAPDGEQIGGNVSLGQLKLAVQTFRQFLNDPERKMIEVAFPDA